MNAELQVLAEGLIELVEVVFVLCDFGEEVHALLNDILANNLEDLVLLEGFTGDVQGQVLRVDNALDEVEVFRDKVLTVVHDENSADVKLDVVALLLGLEEIEGGSDELNQGSTVNIYECCLPLGNVQDCLELKLTLNREMLDGEVLLPVIGERLVESTVLLSSNILRVTRPDGLRLVELLVRGLLLLDLLSLLLLGLVLIILDLLDLGLLFLLLHFIFVFIFDFL
jgi:hypothetical protein